MQYRNEDLIKLQKAETEILSEVIRVCDENGITYFAVGGTALGAVRHSGFIPWDDDVDIGMLREDYERFLKIAPEKLKKGYTLCSAESEPNMPSYFAKVRKDGTVFKEESSKNIKMHHGIFLDVMPYDKIPIIQSVAREVPGQFFGKSVIEDLIINHNFPNYLP